MKEKIQHDILIYLERYNSKKIIISYLLAINKKEKALIFLKKYVENVIYKIASWLFVQAQ